MSQPIHTQLASQEGRMALAIEAYKSGYFTSQRAAAKAYNVLKSTFYTRFQGTQTRQETRSKNLKLSDTEEATLINWILSMEERGLPLRAESIRQIANLLLKKRSANSDTSVLVGERWVYNFVKRHPTLQSKYTRKYDY
jgi:transposase